MSYDYPPEYDYPEIAFENSELRTARKEHKCIVCGQRIRAGQEYTRIFAIVDDAPQVEKFHGVVSGECIDPKDWS